MKRITSIVVVLLLVVSAALIVTGCAGVKLHVSKAAVILEVGATETVIASTSEGGQKVEGTTWSSSNTQVASVEGGKITGISKGTAVITATLNGKSGNVNVTVKDTLGDHKTSKKAELDTYASEKGQQNYTADKWTEIQDAATAGKTAIDNAADIASVDSAVTSAKEAIDAVSKKVLARIEIGTVSGTIVETTPVATNAYGQATTFNESNYKNVDISLVKGDTEYSNVRFEVSINTADALQLFAKDTSNHWYNVLVTGWGPAEGFPIADATTRFYAVGLKAGTHTVTIKLVDVNSSNMAIITETVQVTVTGA